MRKRWLAPLLILGVAAFFPDSGVGQPPKGPPPEPGSVLPPFAREPLKLTAEQQRQVAVLEKDMKSRLAKLLTPQQMKQAVDAFRQGPGQMPKGPPPAGGAPPGLLLPPFVRDKVRLEAKQEAQLDELEKDARTKLDKILTEAQRKQFEDLLRKGPPDRPGQPEPKKPDGKGMAPDPRPNPDGIQWFSTLAGGLAEAKRTQRPILLVSAAPHCGGVSGIW